MFSRKKAAILLDFVQITSPPSPQFGQLVQLFLNAKNVDLRDIQNEWTYEMVLKIWAGVSPSLPIPKLTQYI